MSHGLFRREVTEARSSGYLGGISLAQPLRLRVLAGLAVVAAVAILCFLAFGGYSRRSRVSGQLVPNLGLSIVVAPASGVIGRLFPEEGDRVRAGAALARIDAPRATAGGQDALAVMREGMHIREASAQQLGNSQLAQLDAQIAGSSRQLAIARHELAQVEQSVATRSEQIRLAQTSVDRFRRIADSKYVSQMQVDQQEQARLEQVSAREALERQATALRRDIAQQEQALRELPAQRRALEAALQRDRALLQQERIQQETNGALLIRAPVAGLVASRLVEPGQAVQAGQSLLSLLPQGSRLQAQLLVPSRAVGFIEPGDSVLLRYQAYPYQKFGHYRGHVLAVSRSAVVAESGSSQGGGAGADSYYRVRVALDEQSVVAYGKPEPLRPGMAVEADILGEHRKLYEWLFEPLYALYGRVGK